MDKIREALNDLILDASLDGRYFKGDVEKILTQIDTLRADAYDEGYRDGGFVYEAGIQSQP